MEGKTRFEITKKTLGSEIRILGYWEFTDVGFRVQRLGFKFLHVRLWHAD
jgi:hypothetical protein